MSCLPLFSPRCGPGYRKSKCGRGLNELIAIPQKTRRPCVGYRWSPLLEHFLKSFEMYRSLQRHTHSAAMPLPSTLHPDCTAVTIVRGGPTHHCGCLTEYSTEDGCTASGLSPRTVRYEPLWCRYAQFGKKPAVIQRLTASTSLEGG